MCTRFSYRTKFLIGKGDFTRRSFTSHLRTLKNKRLVCFPEQRADLINMSI